MEVNRPDVVAQVKAAFDAYERALVQNDIDTMNALFWSAPETVRYGIAEIQHGGEGDSPLARIMRGGAGFPPPASHRHYDVRQRFRDREHRIHQRRDFIARPPDADMGEARRRARNGRRGVRPAGRSSRRT